MEIRRNKKGTVSQHFICAYFGSINLLSMVCIKQFVVNLPKRRLFRKKQFEDSFE